jgi:putative spermidine/putrescine transport system substrate-binding protein
MEGRNEMANRLTRRQFLTRGTSLALLSAGCGGKPSGDFAGQQLRIFVYAGGHEKTMREVFVPRFRAATGADAILDAGWWDAIPKLKASPPHRPPYDLLITDATQGFPAARDGLFRQLDLSRIPNHKNLTPAVLDHWIYRERHGIPYPDSVMTLAYRKDAATESPRNWADLLRDDWRGKLGLYTSFYMSLYTFACMKAASEDKAGAAAALIKKDLEAVLKYARTNRERVKIWWQTSTDMTLALVNRDCAAGNMHSPEMLQALRSQPKLGAVVPDSDRAFVQVFWAIPAGATKVDLAEKAIDLIFSEEMQLEFAKRGSATAVLSAARRMADEDPLWASLYPHTEEQFRGLRYYPYDTYFEHWDEIEKFWTREVLRHG